MTEALAFDTHRFVTTLVEGGFTEEQAVALAVAQAAILDKNLATRRDLEKLRLEMRVEVHKIKTDLLKWMIGAMIAQSAVIVALVRLP